ncbi:MAG: LysR family transcriptional regulator [Arenicella sp.]|jgi:DNA-binding transcriptional LysR family regulator|nr:LysR family transcriptional regulator [Arenicella sp.]
MDHISRVAIFLEVVKHNSFSGAARALGITGPAVSKQIQALESELDVRLLTRTTRHVSVTEEGGVYAERARKALDDLNEAELLIQDLKATPKGRLKINAPTSFSHQYLRQPIAEFAKQYPEVEIDLDLSDRWVDVIGEGYDVIIRIGVLRDSTLIAKKLAACPILLCAAPSLLARHPDIKNSVDLEVIPAVVYNQHGRVEDWRYQDESGNENTVRLARSFAVNTAEMQVEACVQGVGIALVPMFSAAPYLNSGELIHVLPKLRTFPERGIYALYPQSRQVAQRARLFIEALSDATKDLPW